MKNPIIRTIYLYLFALVGLIMVTVGTAQLVNLGLKVWVFTKADVIDYSYSQPVVPYFDQAKLNAEAVKSCSDKCEFTAEQKQLIDRWLQDYKTWQEQEKTRDKNAYVDSSRQRQAAQALGLIIVGLPLYLYHWLVIKRDRKDQSSEV
jgi:hypothetical protein